MRVVNTWNSLSVPVVSALSVKSLEKQLDWFWASYDVQFDHEKLLKTTTRQVLDVVTAYEADSDLGTEVAWTSVQNIHKVNFFYQLVTFYFQLTAIAR